MQLVWHPVAVVQYTFTHKQYIEQHVIGKSAGRSTALRVLPWHLPGNWGKSTGKKTQSVWNIWCCYLGNPNNSFFLQVDIELLIHNVCIYMYICMYVYMYVCMWVGVYMCVCVCIFICMYLSRFFYFIPHALLHLVILHAWIYLCYLHTDFSLFAYSM